MNVAEMICICFALKQWRGGVRKCGGEGICNSIGKMLINVEAV